MPEAYKDGARSKTYSVSIKSDEHTEQTKFQESDYFKEKSKERYKIEAKNSEFRIGIYFCRQLHYPIIST